MGNIKVIQKGYTIKVISWENDGDFYNTKFYNTDSLEKAKAIVELCKTLFRSANNVEGGIGNTTVYDEDDYEKVFEIVIPFMKNHPELLKDKTIVSDEDLYEICMDYAFELMGSSEFYVTRVCQSVEVTYSPLDIEVEEIVF